MISSYFVHTLLVQCLMISSSLRVWFLIGKVKLQEMWIPPFLWYLSYRPTVYLYRLCLGHLLCCLQRARLRILSLRTQVQDGIFTSSHLDEGMFAWHGTSFECHEACVLAEIWIFPFLIQFLNHFHHHGQVNLGFHMALWPWESEVAKSQKYLLIHPRKCL